MAIDSRINPGGPRLLTQRNLEKKVLEANGDEVPRPDVGPGMMQLFSYYKPGLTAGNYAIRAEQFITAPGSPNMPAPFGDQTFRVWNWKERIDSSRIDASEQQPRDGQASEPQVFEVMTPQFSLDPKLVNSCYPPEGHQDEGRIVPHIVMNDPYFPWERDVGQTFNGDRSAPLETARERDPDIDQNGQTVDANNKATNDRSQMVYRAIVPWIKLIVFDVDEIQITKLAEAENLGIPQYQYDAAGGKQDTRDIGKQQANYAFSMTTGEYLSSIKVTNRINFEQGYADDKDSLDEIKAGRRSKEVTQVIFPSKDLVYKLFKDRSTIESNKYLAHVRNVNTVGCPNAGLEEDGLFSIVLSGRTGAFNIDQPRTQVVHLVSMEHIDATLASTFKNWGSASDADKASRIGLISLYSWTYTALPPKPVNFIDRIRSIVGDDRTSGNTQMLRPRDELLDKLQSEANLVSDTQNAKTALVQRLKHGYTMSRWRAETGEITAAFGRGPLVPIQTKSTPSSDWPTGSNHAKNYQIFDKTTGLMDLSYSSAWELGKMLAIADTSFSAALMRFRSFIQRKSDDTTLHEINAVDSRAAIVAKVKAAVAEMPKTVNGTATMPQRIVPPNATGLAPGLASPIVAPRVGANIVRLVRSAGSAGDEAYNEFNSLSPNNTDWTAIHQWISDKLYLGGIPAHVLFPDPSFIPEESLRFFYIDDAWLDCLIDGALSLGNHLERDDDRIKNAIKEWYNFYLKTPISKGNLRPQIPCYGFILRSQIIKCMPDMKIEINWNNDNDKSDQRAKVCQWLRPDDHTLVCLLDRFPEEIRGRNQEHPDLGGIILSQPAHQQRFSFGQDLKEDRSGFNFQLRHLYTQGNTNLEWPMKANDNLSPDPGSCIDMKTRIIDVAKLAKTINRGLQLATGIDSDRAYIDHVANSAEFGLELNDPAYYFSVYPEHTSLNITPRLRQLWTPATKDGNNDTDPKDDTEPPDFSGGLGGSVDVLIPQPAPQPTDGIKDVTDRLPSQQQPPIIIKDLPEVAADRVAGEVQPGYSPRQCFYLQIFADYKGTPTPPPMRKRKDDIVDVDKDYVPTQNSELFDLIFVVRKDKVSTKDNNQLLREIVINIPTSPVTVGANKTDALLSANWNGNIRMLSNQRFFPFVNRTKSMIQVRLVPRSADLHPIMRMDDLRTKEISFRLTNADIPQVAVKGRFPKGGGRWTLEVGFARVDMYERYQNSRAGVQSVYNDGTYVIKKDTDK